MTDISSDCQRDRQMELVSDSDPDKRTYQPSETKTNYKKI
jgi:hypothetical protein